MKGTRWGNTPQGRRWLDLGIAVGLCGFALLFISPHTVLAESGDRERDTVGVILILAQTLPLMWRQAAPRTVLVAISMAWILDRGMAYEDTIATLGLVVAIHALAASLPARQAYAWGVGVATVSGGWTVAGMFLPDTTVRPVHLAAIWLLIAIPFAIGRADALARQRITELEVAHLGAREAERAAAQAAIRTERARIARELHDVVAHEITVMTLQAEGARRALGNTNPAVRQALETIGDSGRKGLVEMNRMIGVLRDSSEPDTDEAEVGTSFAPASVAHLDPMPALASLPALAQQVEDAGLPVDLKIIGKAHVPAGVELSAYRIVQESLTNALKHAGPGSRATATVLRDSAAVTVTVEDDGRGVITDALAKGGGHGLAGIRERVLALGGSIEFGPRPGGGFRLRAILPSHDDTVLPPSRRSNVAAAKAPSKEGTDS